MDVTIACVCPGSRHESDTVTLRERLDFRSVLTIRKASALVDETDRKARAAEILALLSEQYLVFGISGWTLTDAKGKHLDVSHDAIRAIFLEDPDHIEQAMTLTDAADELYGDTVLLPLLLRAQSSSPPSSTTASTSATPGSGTTTPTPSRRSSTSTTRTAGTGTITPLPVGGSSSSRSAATAS